MKKTMKVIHSGLAECIRKPMGDNGLEGYNLKTNYHFSYMQKEGIPNYYRMYPTDDTYYETCGEQHFNRFFKKVKVAR